MSDTQTMVATGGNNHVTIPQGMLDKALEMTPEVTPQVEAPKPVKELSVFEVTAKQPTQETVQETKESVPVVEQQKVTDQILELPDDAKVRILLDGKEEVVNVKDYRNTLQREALWTKRMQTLAQQRKEAENEIAQQYAYLQQQALVIQAAREALKAQSPQREDTVQKQQPKADELATLGEVNTTVDQRLEALNKDYQDKLRKLEENFQNTIQRTQINQVRDREAEKFTTALHQVLGDKEVKILTQVVPSPEYLEAIVRHNVANMDASSMDEAINNMKVFVKGWVDNVKKSTLGEQKVEAAAAARAVLEPDTAGSPPAPQKLQQHQTIFRKDGSVDWQALSARAASITLDA